MGEGAETGELAEGLEAAVAGVYQGPLEEFIARRDALVAELRAAGRRDDANQVKRWRKPTRTAWSLDAAVLQDRANAERLATAVATMVAAQSGSGDVRAASEQLRVAVRDLASAAAQVAANEGHPVDRAGLVPAVMAVIADPDALAALRAGRLTDIPPPKELGLLSEAPPDVDPALAADSAATAAGTATTASAAGAKSAQPGAPDVADIDAAQAAVQESEAEAAIVRERADAADRAVADREAALDAANERLRRVEQETRTARDQLREAQQAAKAARQQVRQAERAAASARAKLATLTR